MALPQNLAQAHIPEAVGEILARLQAGGFQAFLVGGCVRDLLLGRPPKDFDLATSARPDDVRRLFRKVIPTGVQHGTVTVLHGKAQVEVTTFRSEGAYRDGRRPSSVTFHANVAEDLARRDFTINAMAFDPLQGALVDPFGGQRDLSLRVVRCVGDPLERFGEDGLRPLRAVRFAAVLGFSLDPPTREAIPRTLEVFGKVARERMREEFSKLLLSDRPKLGLLLLEETGLLTAFLPEALEAPSNLDRRAQVVQELPAELGLRLAALLEGAADVEPTLRRLSFPNGIIEQVGALVAQPLPEGFAGLSDGELRRWVSRVGPGRIGALLALARAQRGAAVDEFRRRVEALLAQRPPLSPKELALDGQRIMAVLGVGPSPAVGRATRFLLDQVLEHPELNSVAELTRLLQQWVASGAR